MRLIAGLLAWSLFLVAAVATAGEVCRLAPGDTIRRRAIE